jgi:pimeloyl-ACP methyl ester carboxylesterase
MTEQPLTKKTVDVLDARIAYHERGEGAPVLFLHGNPTSSFLWRDVIPELEGHGRLIAPDLIGMGDSAKLPNPDPDTYRFTTHRKYLAAFIDAVIGAKESAKQSIVLVVHDWGSALGFDWANHHRDRIRGIAYMEAIVRPVASWDEWSASATPIFQGFRSDKGETMILERNMFIERVLPGSILRDRGRDDRISPAVCAPCGPLADADLAAADSDSGRARRGGADCGGLFAMDGRERPAKAVRQRRARRDPDRYAAGFLPKLEEPDRGDRPGLALHSGGFRAGDRSRSGQLDQGERAIEAKVCPHLRRFNQNRSCSRMRIAAAPV